MTEAKPTTEAAAPKPASNKVERKKAAGTKVRKAIPQGNIYITASYNNTVMTLADPNGNVLVWSSAGTCGFKGTRKATPYAATVTAEKLMEKAAPYGVEKVKLFVKGVGTGREQAIRGLQAAGLELEAIFDTTPVPHNGCRKRKARRV